jgi:hypothetical protein
LLELLPIAIGISSVSLALAGLPRLGGFSSQISKEKKYHIFEIIS